MHSVFNNLWMCVTKIVKSLENAQRISQHFFVSKGQKAKHQIYSGKILT